MKRPLYAALADITPWDEASRAFLQGFHRRANLQGADAHTLAVFRHFCMQAHTEGYISQELLIELGSFAPWPRVDATKPPLHYDYALTVNPFIREGLELVRAGKLTADKVTQDINGLTQLLAMCDYGVYGQQAYQVGPRMQNLLGRTKLNDIDPGAAKMPYPCFYILTPDSGIKLWGGATGLHDLCGFYVRATVISKKPVLLFSLWGAPNERSFSAGDDATAWFFVDLPLLAEMGDIEAYFDRLFQMAEDLTEIRDMQNQPAAIKRLTDKARRYAAHLLFSLLFYLQTERPQVVETAESALRRRQRLEAAKKRAMTGTQKPKKLRALDRAITTISEAVIHAVCPQLEQAPQAATDREPGRRHWVSGHYWPRENPRRWVMPYERNVDSPVLTPGRTYTFSRDKP